MIRFPAAGILAAAAPASAPAAQTTPDPAVPEIAENVDTLTKFLEDVWNSFLNRLPLIGCAIVLLIVGIFVSKLTVRLMRKGLERSKVDLTVKHFFVSVVKITLYVLLFTVILTLLGVPTTSIIAVIGTAGVAISLALQNSLSNLFGGFIILISKPFHAGDYIEVSNTEGFVESINILYTKLRTYQNKAIYIPNGIASNAVLINATESEKRRVDHIFNISYNADFETAVKSIENALKKCPQILWEGTDKPFIRMSDHALNSIEITVRVWCKTKDYWDVYFDVVEKVRAQFIEDNIEIPYQQIDVHMKEH